LAPNTGCETPSGGLFQSSPLPSNPVAEGVDYVAAAPLAFPPINPAVDHL